MLISFCTTRQVVRSSVLLEIYSFYGYNFYDFSSCNVQGHRHKNDLRQERKKGGEEGQSSGG